MNDINASEEWVLETPPPSRTSNMNESINTSPKLYSVSGNKSPPIYGKTYIYNEFEEEWIVETPPNCSTLQIKSLQEKSTLKSVPINEITLINENNKSEDRMFSNRSALNTNNLNRTLEEERILGTHSRCNTDETNRVMCEERCRKSSRKSHFEPCANSKLHGKKWGRSRNNLTNSKLKNMNELHENKFVKSYFKSDGNNNRNNNIDRDIYKRTLNRKPIHSLKDVIYESDENRFINLPYRFNKSDLLKGGEKKWKPNIEAPEFVPESMKRLKSEFNTEQFSPNSSTYSHFSLRDLLNYDMDLMPSELLMDYANALKLRVLEQMFEFEPSFRDELKVLCQLIDGGLTDRNKRIISLRICTLVERTVLNKPQWNQGHYQGLH